jgi:biopolymer transport protein ExbB
MMKTILLQINQTGADFLMEDPEPVEKTLSVVDIILGGGIGGIVIMGILFVLSMLAVYIFTERFQAIKRANKIDLNFMNHIKDHVSQGRLDAARALCQSSNSPVALMIEKGINRIGRPLNDISASIENQGKLEIQKLENNLPFLATIAGGAPMIGFLGTVIGMVLAFSEMANAGGQVDVGMLAEGIYTAMSTTVAGLAVGIIAYFGYNYLVARVEKVIFKLEASATEFLDLLNEPA